MHVHESFPWNANQSVIVEKAIFEKEEIVWYLWALGGRGVSAMFIRWSDNGADRSSQSKMKSGSGSRSKKLQGLSFSSSVSESQISEQRFSKISQLQMGAGTKLIKIGDADIPGGATGMFLT